MKVVGATIAVTGSTGFVGRRLVQRLTILGCAVKELDGSAGSDVRIWSDVERLGRCDVVVHLAARTFIPDSFASPRETIETNTVGTLNMLELCRRTGARMVFASTYVYGKVDAGPIREDGPVAALNPYTESKIVGERLCGCYHRDFGVRCTILRPFNVYGPGQSRRFLIPTIIEQAHHGTVTLRDGTPRRDFVYIDDVVQAYVSASESELDECAAYNIGSGVSYSVRELVEMIRERVNPNCPVFYMNETRQGEVMETLADVGRAKDRLGWAPRITIEQGLDWCIRAEGYVDECARSE